MAGLTGSSGNLNIGTVARAADHAYTPNATSARPEGYSKVTAADVGVFREVPAGINLEIWRNNDTGSIMVGIRGSLDSADFAKDTQILSGSTPQAASDAAVFIQEIARFNPGFAITLTGHSFGGYVANSSQIKAQDNGIQNVSAVAFDPLGIQLGELDGSASAYNIVNFYSRADPAYNASVLKGLVQPGNSVAVDFVGPDPATVVDSIRTLSQNMAVLQDPSLANGITYTSTLFSAYRLASGLNDAHSSTPMTDRMVDLGRKGFTVNGLGDPDRTPLTPGVCRP